MREQYQALPRDDGGVSDTHARKTVNGRREIVRVVLSLLGFATLCFAMGFGAGQNWTLIKKWWSQPRLAEDKLLHPQAFIPEIPPEGVKFEFPTAYESTGIDGDQLWRDLLPLGSGFVRVPYPRRFDMPQSKSIENDPEEGEIYSLSGVLRDVIKKYEKKDKSRFAGEGHEYHCIDYIRQAIMCAGDTTLDFAEPVLGPDGIERRLGFTGSNSTHICRSWDAIKLFAIENRSGDNFGIA